MSTGEAFEGQASVGEQHDNLFWHAFIGEAEAAEFMGFTVRCLQGWRYRGGGPPFYSIGGRIRYKRIDLARHAEERRRSSTSDPGAA